MTIYYFYFLVLTSLFKSPLQNYIQMRIVVNISKIYNKNNINKFLQVLI